ncbi:MAG: hypothetical protein RIS45_341 [Planctomycetota bacterium]|jgi:hypothetical protein
MSTEKPAAVVTLRRADHTGVIVPAKGETEAQFRWLSASPGGLLAEGSSSHSETVPTVGPSRESRS